MGEEKKISINFYGYISHSLCLMSAYHVIVILYELFPIITKIQQDRYRYPHLVGVTLRLNGAK